MRGPWDPPGDKRTPPLPPPHFADAKCRQPGQIDTEALILSHETPLESSDSTVGPFSFVLTFYFPLLISRATGQLPQTARWMACLPEATPSGFHHTPQPAAHVRHTQQRRCLLLNRQICWRIQGSISKEPALISFSSTAPPAGGPCPWNLKRRKEQAYLVSAR